VANSSYGTNKVDAESIYRIGSISKLLTVYLWLVREGDVRWSDPIAKHLPELLKYKADSWNNVTPDWNAITIGDLAGQSK
jgi:CubicO group peptidase (beta-lactamase class C family)